MKKTAIKAMVLFSIILFGCANTSSYQSVLNQTVINNQSNTRPKFSVGYINVATPKSPEWGETKVWINIPYSELRFEEIAHNKWQALYNSEARLTHSSAPIDYISFPSKTIVVKKYQATKDPELSMLRLIEYSLPQAQYQLDIKIVNKSSSKTSPLRIPILTRKIVWGSFNISDPVFFSKKSDGENFLNTLHDSSDSTLVGMARIPLNPQTLDPWRPVNIMHEVYLPPNPYLSLNGKKVILGYKLFFENKVIFKKEKILEITPETKQREIIGIQLSLPDDAGNGIYQLTIHAYIKDKESGITETISYMVSKLIEFYSAIPRSEKEMNDAFGAMEYVAHPLAYKVSKDIKKAESATEKKNIFIDFWWGQRPGALEEYYVRINYANRKLRGWKTDQGKVFVRFGPPRDEVIIIKGFMEGGLSSKTWHYNLSSASPSSPYSHKAFIFVDEWKTGNYTFGRSDYWLHNQAEFDSY